MSEFPARGAMELLAPAGDMDALLAAIAAGADAVYLGGKALSARKNAGNFDVEGLRRAAEICHERGRRAYVTVNTLLRDEEFSLLEELVGQMARAGVDAAIVQDFGVAAALKAMLPGLGLHASTQMAVHNRQGVDFLKANGFSRVVLAREMAFPEIKDCAGRGVALEVFVHGALCVSCSGQCLMSSVIGGRSGNRGLCAQPCRLNYRLEGPVASAEGALLSTRDLNLLSNLRRLKDAGAGSLKIEGRLKGPEYVGQVTAAYRRALDALEAGETPEPDALKHVFNRGYTAGYAPGLTDRDLIEDQTEKHVDGTGGNPVVPRPVLVDAVLTVEIGKPMTLRVSDGVDGAEVSGEAAQVAQSRPADRERLTGQLQKTGGTPYEFRKIDITVSPDAFVPVSAVNILRRRALEALGAVRIERRRGCGPEILPLPEIGAMPKWTGGTLLSVQSRDAQVLEQARGWGADELVFEPSDITEEGLNRAPSVPFALALPPTLNGDDLARLNRWAGENGNVEAVLLSNPAQLSLSWRCPVRLDASMNLMNNRAASCFDLPYVPSVELTAKDIERLGGEKEIIVYGRLPLMRLRHCPVRARLGGRHEACRLCDERPGEGLEAHSLTDRKGARTPMRRLKTPSGCIVELDNCVPLLLLRNAGRIPGAARWRIRLTAEDEAPEAIVRLHRAALDGEDFKSLPGWSAMDALPTTTGHYFRGVE
jgi:putative protease